MLFWIFTVVVYSLDPLFQGLFKTRTLLALAPNHAMMSLNDALDRHFLILNNGNITLPQTSSLLFDGHLWVVVALCEIF